MPEVTRLNLPGRMARYFVDSRLTVLLAVALMLCGLLGLVFTPREENPRIVVPAAEVIVALPGALPREVEHLLLAPLEAQLAAVNGVKHVYGTALEGAARVVVEFEVGQDKEDATVRLYDHVLRHRSRLPPGAGEPRIEAIDVDDVPVFTLAVASDRYPDDQLRRVAERVLERLRSVRGVGIGYVTGGRRRELRIEASPERLEAFGVGLDEVAAAVAAADVSRPLGLRVYGGVGHALRVTGRLVSREQVEAIVVHEDAGRLLRVVDLARVVDGPPAEIEHMTRLAFGLADPRLARVGSREIAAVSVALAKRGGVNAVPLTRALRARVEQMRHGLVPPEIHLVVTRDDGQTADRAVTRLVEHLYLAMGAVAAVLFALLGWRAAAIVSLAIPLVFSAVTAADLIAGPTLNRITLYALILALGMLVDDAVVVCENVHRHLGGLPVDAGPQARARTTLLATHEIGNPTTLATLTVVTVFLSLSLVTGMLGQYFYPITFNVPVAMIASLLVAYSVVPWFASRFLVSGPRRGEGGPALAQRLYYRLARALLRGRAWRYALYAAVTGLLVASLLQPAWQFIRPQGVAGPTSALGVPLAFLPKDDRDTFLIHVHLPEATPLEVTDRAARELGELLRAQPYVLHYQTYVGLPAVIDFNGQLRGSGRQVGPQYADLRVHLVGRDRRVRTSIELVRALRPAVAAIAAGYPGGVFQIVEDPPGPPVRATVLAEIHGPGRDALSGVAERVARAFVETYDMAEVWTSVPAEVSEYRIRVAPDKAALAGVSPGQVETAVARLLGGEVLAHAHPPGEREPVPIRLHVPRAQRIDPALLERASVRSSVGRSVPLSELTEVQIATRPQPILHQDAERVAYVGGELAGSAPIYAVLDLDRRLDGASLPGIGRLATLNLGLNPVRPNGLAGYQLIWEGELRLTLDAFRDMGLALGIALAAIYLLLVAYYRSFSLPLLAMSSVPLALIGVFPGHWLLGKDFSAASMVGVIALAGVVVRNSLLLIDFARDYRARGHSVDRAVLEAGAVRLRPILLTTLAIALGTAVMLSDPVMGGLATSLIFGTLSSAALSVLIVPLLYRAWEGLSRSPSTGATRAG